MANLSPHAIEETGDGGLPFVRIQNQAGMARVCLLGASVTEFAPAGTQPVLWVSPNSQYKAGKPIRGGIPVCWPWFGQHATPGFPMHGFVRSEMWHVVRVEDSAADQTSVVLGIEDNAESHQLWPYHFSLELKVTVGADLVLTLTSINRDERDIPFSAALHTYFRVADVATIRIEGLDQVPFLSKVHNYEQFVESGPIVIGERVDRVYLNTESTCTIDDPGFSRKIVVEKSGSRTTVVWNPWAKLSAEMAELGPEAYRQFVCVETVVGPQEQMVLPAGKTHAMTVRIRLE